MIWVEDQHAQAQHWLMHAQAQAQHWLMQAQAHAQHWFMHAQAQAQLQRKRRIGHSALTFNIGVQH